MSEISYTWEVYQLECKPHEDQLINIVSKVYWRINAIQDGEILLRHHDVVEVPFPNPEEFTPFENLTELIVKTWVEQIVPIQEIQTYFEQKVQREFYPPTIILPLPWEPQENSDSAEEEQIV